MTDIAIRFYELDDASELYEAARESVFEVYKWLPWCHPEYGIKESEVWLAEQVEKRQEGIEFAFAIVDSDGSYLGGCGLNEIDYKQKTANLGYWIRSSAMGQGIATKAVARLSAWGFKNTDLIRLEIKCAVKNARSQRVAEKSGAVREGIRKSCLDIHGKKHDAVVFVIKRNKTTEQGAAPDSFSVSRYKNRYA